MDKLIGYQTPAGYIGIVNGTEIIFSTEQEYDEYLKEAQSE